jgi:citrate synthase
MANRADNVSPQDRSHGNEWVSAISDVQGGRIGLYGYSLAELAANLAFGNVVYLAMTGRLPGDTEARMMDAIMTACVVQAISPSGAIARTLAGCGAPIQTSVIGGLLSITDKVGGATERLGAALEDSFGHCTRRGEILTDPDLNQVAYKAIEKFTDANGRIGRVDGLGHLLHPEGDPRAIFLLKIAGDLGVKGRHCHALERIAELVSEKKRRTLRPNLDGAAVAILMDIGVHWRFASSVILVGRAVGLSAQAVEQTVMPSDFLKITTPMSYVGVSPRALAAGEHQGLQVMAKE